MIYCCQHHKTFQNKQLIHITLLGYIPIRKYTNGLMARIKVTQIPTQKTNERTPTHPPLIISFLEFFTCYTYSSLFSYSIFLSSLSIYPHYLYNNPSFLRFSLPSLLSYYVTLISLYFLSQFIYFLTLFLRLFFLIFT